MKDLIASLERFDTLATGNGQPGAPEDVVPELSDVPVTPATPPEPDPDDVLREAERARAEVEHKSRCAAIERMANGVCHAVQSAMRAEEISRASRAAAFDAALRALLPELLRRVGRVELTEACASLLTRVPSRSTALHIPHATDEDTVDALRARLDGSVHEIVLDPDLAEDTAALRWTGGGADLDMAVLLEAALSAIDPFLTPYERGLLSHER